MTHKEYCYNRMMRLNASVNVAPDGGETWNIDGKELTRQEVDNIYPVEGQLNDWRKIRYAKGKNPNVRNNYKDL